MLTESKMLQDWINHCIIIEFQDNKDCTILNRGMQFPISKQPKPTLISSSTGLFVFFERRHSYSIGNWVDQNKTEIVPVVWIPTKMIIHQTKPFCVFVLCHFRKSQPGFTSRKKETRKRFDLDEFCSVFFCFDIFFGRCTINAKIWWAVCLRFCRCLLCKQVGLGGGSQRASNWILLFCCCGGGGGGGGYDINIIYLLGLTDK